MRISTLRGAQSPPLMSPMGVSMPSKTGQAKNCRQHAASQQGNHGGQSWWQGKGAVQHGLAKLKGIWMLEDNKLAAAHGVASHEETSWSEWQQHSTPLPQPSAVRSKSPEGRV